MREFIEEVVEEFVDFIEDFRDLIRKRPSKDGVKKKPVIVGGRLTMVRPAYLFAERVENAMKILFGASILLSAATSTFIGFSSLSGLVEVLIETVAGRLIMVIIGLSYLTVALWRTLRLEKPPQNDLDQELE